MYYFIFISIFIIGFLINFFLFVKKSDHIQVSLEDCLKKIDKLREEKKEFLKEIAVVALGYISKEDIDLLQLKISEMEQEISSKKGQISLTESEVESLSTRIKELEEIQNDILKNDEFTKEEIAKLEEDQKSIEANIIELKAKLQEAIDKLDSLFDLLAGVSGAEQAITKAKTELLNAEKQLDDYLQEINKVNKKFVYLKQAYDSLDIEYAELYEKQGLG